MKATVGKGKILELVIGDITLQDTEAIVNAANSSLLGGGGVDGAIHKAAGRELYEHCKTLDGCPTGSARITLGFKLKAEYIIHAVGPIYRGGLEGEAQDLAGAYQASMGLAVKEGIKSVAFPAISTGVYSYPLQAAAHIALETVIEYLDEETNIELVRFILFDQATYSVFDQALIDVMVKAVETTS